MGGMNLQGLIMGLPTLGEAWGAGGAEVPTNLLRDRFTTNRAAGAVNSTNAEPGPGTRTVVDPNSRITIASDALVGTPGGSGSFNTYMRYDSVAHGASPQAVVARIGAANVRVDVGFMSASNSNGTPRIEASSTPNFRAINIGSVNTPVTVSLPQNAAIMRDGGGRVMMFWDNRLYWVDEGTDTAAWYATLAFPATTAGGSVDDMQTLALPSSWASVYAMATVNVASPTAATNYTATANQVVRLTVTAPAVLANRSGLIFRGDATDGWRAYFDSAGAFKVARIVGGVEQAASVNVAGVISGGATVTISLVMDGNLINAHSIASGAPTNRGTQINNSHQASNANLQVEIGAGWTVSNLRSWQADNAGYATDLAFL